MTKHLNTYYTPQYGMMNKGILKGIFTILQYVYDSTIKVKTPSKP